MRGRLSRVRSSAANPAKRSVAGQLITLITFVFKSERLPPVGFGKQ
jgi:hypothetical protein